ncbi:MAG: hypothetical protein QGF00_17880 [Planctomycetota bacterium]|nr:hypothetical protein [Planctomycetota bacterium]
MSFRGNSRAISVRLYREHFEFSGTANQKPVRAPLDKRQDHSLWVVVQESESFLSLDGKRQADWNFDLGEKPELKLTNGDAVKLTQRPRLQPLASILVADDFMRTNKDEPFWEGSAGVWGIQASHTPDHASNAFRYFGKSNTRTSRLWLNSGLEPAVSLSQLTYWFSMDYRVGVSLKVDDPAAAAGIVFYARSARNYHLVRWAQHELQLCRVRDDIPEILARSPLPRGVGWYRLEAAICKGRLAAYVDGNRILEFPGDGKMDAGLIAGKAGLFVQSQRGVWFDDVFVQSIGDLPGPALKRPFGPAEKSSADFSDKRFSTDRRMRSWAHPRAVWEEGSLGLHWFATDLYNDFKFQWKAPYQPPTQGKVAFLCQRGDLKSGYVFEWSFGQARLMHQGKVVAQAKGNQRGLSSLSAKAEKGKLAVTASGVSLQAKLSGPVSGTIAADLGRTSGWHFGRRDWRDETQITSSHLKQYAFDSAPTAWLPATGIWQSTNRWACVPRWSFFGGRGMENAIIWNKRRIEGDFDLEVAFAPMEGSAQRMHFSFPMTLNITFAADGRTLDSGYNLVFGTIDVPSQLYRKDKLIASNDSFLVPGLRLQRRPLYQSVTVIWQRVRIRRKGSRITVFAAKFGLQGEEYGYQRLFEFTDPSPLPGDRFAFWTWGKNGMAVAKVRLSYAKSAGTIVSKEASQKTGVAFHRVIRKGPIDPAKEGLLKFRCQISPRQNLGLFIRRRQEFSQFILCGAESYRTGAIPLGRLDTKADGKWHEVTADIRSALKKACPDDSNRVIDEVFIGSPLNTVREIGGLGINRQDATCEVADVSFSLPSKPVPALLLPPPTIVVHGRVALNDFESGLDEWQTHGGTDGALLWRDPANASNGKYSLRLWNMEIGGPAGARITRTPFNAQLFPRIQFDYRFPFDLEQNLLVRSGEKTFEIGLTGTDSSWPQIAYASITADGKWHSASIDLEAALRPYFYGNGPIPIDEILLADSERMGNRQDVIYHIDNFCLVPAVSKTALNRFTFFVPGHEVAEFSHVFNAKPETIPGTTATGKAKSLEAKVPAGASWLHVRIKAKNGKWSPACHLPLIVRDQLGKRLPSRAKPTPGQRIAYVPSDRFCFYDYEGERKEQDWSVTLESDGLDDSMLNTCIRRCAWVDPYPFDAATGISCVQAENIFAGDYFSMFIHKGAWDIRRYPYIAFDYKFEDTDSNFDLAALLNKELFVLEWASPGFPYFQPYRATRLPFPQRDRKWHHLELNLLDLLKKHGRVTNDAIPLMVEQLNTWTMRGSRVGQKFRIDNFTIYSRRGRNPELRWGFDGLKIRYTLRNGKTTVFRGDASGKHSHVFKNLSPGNWIFELWDASKDGQPKSLAVCKFVIE